MNIVVLGLGYVGATAAACLLKDGHTVRGIDVNPDKAAAVAAGRSPVAEPGLDALLAEGAADGRLSAATELGAHLDNADLAIVCVGTPSQADGALDLTHIRTVTQELGTAVAGRDPARPPLVIAYRSTMYPGSMDGVVLPALSEAAGEGPGRRYEAVLNPEFLRESTAVADYYAPARIVLGEREPGAGKRMLGVYDHIEAPFFELSYREAEMVKLADNGFHALKVAFANEVGRLALELDVAPGKWADVFLADDKLNISPYYLRPGGAFGGSCLPKDVRAFVALGRLNGIDNPVMGNLIASNEAHKRYLAQRILAQVPNGGSVLLVGLTFKAETDDLRESPLIDLAETLIGKGIDLKIFDSDLKYGDLVGANLQFVQNRLPHLGRLLVEDIDAAGTPDLVVFGKRNDRVRAALPSSVPAIDIDRL